MKNIFQVVSILCLLLVGQYVIASVDINTADAETLAKEISGVGQKKAAAIVAYRTENGLFKTVDELMLVKGIGEKTVDKNRENLTVSQPATESTTQ